jgi:hypothetical protein
MYSIHVKYSLPPGENPMADNNNNYNNNNNNYYYYYYYYYYHWHGCAMPQCGVGA